ncbi:Sterile alpha motif containing protein, partial [Oryctes borbonicus]
FLLKYSKKTMDNKYEIVETILRAAGGEKYLNNFKEYRIDLSSLKLLNDEDLSIIGVNEATRTNILKNCANFQMRLESRTNLVFTEEYIQTVFNQIINQLKLQHANLVCAALREDTVVCDIKLRKACRALLYHVQQLENELYLIRKKFHHRKTTRKMPKTIFISVIAVAVVGFAIKRFMKI